MVNYFTMFKDVPRVKNSLGQQTFAPDALCLLYLNSEEKLMPIAIQLEANNLDTVFTPQDEKYDWLLAKMYFKTTDGCMHEVGN